MAKYKVFMVCVQVVKLLVYVPKLKWIILKYIMMEETGKGRAYIPEGLTKAYDVSNQLNKSVFEK